MAELSDNVRWLVTNLIDQDQRICVELQRRGEEYTAAGRPRDGSLQRDARLLVEDVVRQHNDMWPEASIGFTPEELDRAAGMVAKRIDEQAGFAWAESVEAEHEPAPRQTETVGPAVDSDGPTERARGRASTLDGIRQRASARTGSMQADAAPMPRQTRSR